MKRMVEKCMPEFRKRTGCSMMEDGDTCEYRTKKGYCGYYDTMNSKGEKQLFEQFDRLGQLEDEAEQREKGCKYCTLAGRDDEIIDKLPTGEYVITNGSGSMIQVYYCPKCGRKLV